MRRLDEYIILDDDDDDDDDDVFFEDFFFEFFVKGKKVDETNALYVPTTVHKVKWCSE